LGCSEPDGSGLRRVAIGDAITRREDEDLLTRGGNYVEDVSDPLLEGAVHVCFVRSTEAHALIDVHVDDVKGQPGVVGAFVGADLDLGPFPFAIPIYADAMRSAYLATDRVRYVGEPIAAVVATSLAEALDAAQLVAADYQPLPVVVDIEEALRDEVLLFPDHGTNTAISYEMGSEDDLFAGCEVVVDAEVRWPRLAPCPLEGRSAASVWSPDGRLHHWLSSQAPQASRGLLSRVLEVEESLVRVVSPDVGGGFGAKHGSYPEDVLLAWISRAVGRPARWTESRTEGMLGMSHGRSQIQRMRIGGTRDGRILAYRLELLQDAGAYPAMGGYTPGATGRMAAGPYDIPRFYFTSRAVVTNTTTVGAYRGAGRPEATAAIERAVDLFALEVGMDPVEVRRRNLVPAHAFPYRNGVGMMYDTGDYERALDMVLGAADYGSLRHEQANRRRSPDAVQLGIGTATYVQSTGGPALMSEFGRVQITADGTVVVDAGTMPHGQGHVTVWTSIVSETLGVAPDQVVVRSGDTDISPSGFGTFGSRSGQLAGSAILQCSEILVERAKHLTADLLEANRPDVVFDNMQGRFHVAGSPSMFRTWTDIVAASGRPSLGEECTYESSAPTFAFGAHLAVVETDLETGRVRLIRFVSVDDAGRLLNPLIVEGQRHGGAAQGIAQVVLEEFVYDAAGTPLTTNLADYAMISAAELPSFDLLTLETPTPINPLGAKGIGEASTGGAIAAVQSAIFDSVHYLGVGEIDMPATPERVWRAVQRARGG
jgi:carbon-monoxide dehydrogenase large subunit